ncbi:AAA family ATPase [Ureibacillus chungkukjangi]|uniref:AAA family ATPase n=1 Tax=Ureibacillus chungkukjangi TaxID=1202712 RepID=UPI002040DCA4|nr:AAA family ATPase [Ureibacillus chungkukjangi]MCM3387256.1 AAA family ATPase [Ureibacillus chungkukjangi]
MSKLIMLVGLPASGKSTKAKELSEEYNATILSSDLIREELLGNINDQSHNVNVFEVMNNRARELLNNGQNVIYDATNINRKRRMHLIKTELKADKYICYYLGLSMGRCLYNDSQRERTVGFEVIDKMYKTMQIPIKKEGWDELYYLGSEYRQPEYMFDTLYYFLNNDFDYDELMNILIRIDSNFEDIKELSQDSTYHSFSVSRHTYHVYKYILENYQGKKRREMLLAAVYHDIGKAYCKSFYNYNGEECKYANFIGHEHVSSQIAYDTLMSIGLNTQMIINVVTLIQFHMKPKNMSEKTKRKLQELLGEEMYSDLMFLNEADNLAK